MVVGWSTTDIFMAHVSKNSLCKLNEALSEMIWKELSSIVKITFIFFFF